MYEYHKSLSFIPRKNSYSFVATNRGMYIYIETFPNREIQFRGFWKVRYLGGFYVQFHVGGLSKKKKEKKERKKERKTPRRGRR